MFARMSCGAVHIHVCIFVALFTVAGYRWWSIVATPFPLARATGQSASDVEVLLLLQPA